VIREVVVFVVKLVRVFCDLGDERFETGEEFFLRTGASAEPEPVMALVPLEDVLHFQPEFLGQLDDRGVAGVDQLAAEFDEHAVLVEAALGEHPAAETFGAFEQFHGDALRLQPIGGGQACDSATDDGHRAGLSRVGPIGPENGSRSGELEEFPASWCVGPRDGAGCERAGCVRA